MLLADRSLCGWRVRSELALPELPVWAGDDRAPEVEIRFGEVPEDFGPLVHQTPFLRIAASGACRFEVAAVGAYLIEAGRRVTIAPGADPDAPDLRVFLFGTVFGMLCHQRGLLPLHAGCVDIDGRAVAIAGVSGAGKSTLSLALARRGHQVLADDVCVVDWRAAAGPLALPAAPRLRLWRDALDRFAISPDGLERSRPTLEKYHLDLGERFRVQPLPLAAVYHLVEARPPRPPGFIPLRGVAAMSAIGDNVYRGRPGVQLNGTAALCEVMLRLAQRVRVTELRRADDLAGVDDLAAALERHVSAQAP